jgi:hypothetical protein
MASKAAGLDLEDFDRWSSGGSNYSEQDTRSLWKSIHPTGGIGAGTLFHMAREVGWREGSSSLTCQLPTEGLTRPEKPPNARAPDVDAVEVWASCVPATDLHPYIVAKEAQGVPLDDLRVVPPGDAVRVMGEAMDGALAVPCRRQDGSLSTIQFITTGAVAERLRAGGKPTKLSLPGCRIEGWHMVGEAAPGSEVFVAEGIGTAWAAWRATGRPCAVTFGAGRLRAVAQGLRERDPNSTLTLCPDRGLEEKALEIARDLCAGVRVAVMPNSWPANADLADLASAEGAEAVESLLEAAKPPEPAPLPFALVPVSDLEAQDPLAPEFVWENLIPAETVTLLAAHGGTGKSFVALMLCVAVACGMPLFGLGTRQGKAAFFSGEDGAALLRYRLRVICRRMGVDVRDLEGRLFIIDATEHDPRLYVEAAGRRDGDLTATFEGLREFVQREGIGLLVLDNASDTFDASEIDRARVRAFMRALTVLARQAKAGVLLLAHVDKGTSRGDRGPNTEGYSGSTAWHNSARSRLFMRRDAEGALLLEHQKGTHSAGLMQPLRLAWVKDGIPMLDEPLSPMMQGMTDRADTKALLRLIHEFSERGEWVATATNSRNHAAKLLRQEPTFPRLKGGEVFDLLRQAERAGQLERVVYRNADRKERERWRVSSQGREFARIAPTAPSAPTSYAGTDGAPVAPSAPTALGGMGEGARALWSDREATVTSSAPRNGWAVNEVHVEHAYGT